MYMLAGASRIQKRERGRINNIFALRNIIEQCIEWNAPIVIIFIDFKKSFDSVHRWKHLLSYGIHLKIATHGIIDSVILWYIFHLICSSHIHNIDII
jgi:hypothetical protein